MDKEASKNRYRIPWWLYLLFAIISYCTLKYILPSLATPGSASAKLFALAPEAAPILAIVFLLLCANGLYRDDPLPKSDEGKDKPPQEEPPS